MLQPFSIQSKSSTSGNVQDKKYASIPTKTPLVSR